MAKGVANLYRYAEVSLAANARYLQALADVQDPAAAQQHLGKMGNPIRRNGRSYRGLNPIAKLDVQLFAAVLRAEHFIMGFRNRDIRRQLFPKTKDSVTIRRQSSRVSRLLKLLNIHQLIAKIPRSRRWRITLKAQRLLSIPYSGKICTSFPFLEALRVLLIYVVEDVAVFLCEMVSICHDKKA